MFMSMLKLALSSLTSAWYSIVNTSILYVRALFGPTRTPRLPATRTVSAPYPAISTTSTFPSSSGPLVHGFFLFTAVAAGFLAGVFLIYLRLTPPRQRKHLAQALSLRKLLKAASAFGFTTITHIKSLLPSLAGPLRYASTLLSAVAAIVSTYLHTRYPTLIPRVKQAKSRLTASHVSFFVIMLLQFTGLALFYALQPISHDEAVKALFSCFSSTPAPDSYDYRFGVCAPATFAPLYIPAIAFGSFVISVIFLVTIWSELFDSPSSYHHLPQSRHIRAPILNRHLSLRKLLKAASAFGVTTITHIKPLLPYLAGPLRYASTLLSAVAAIVSTYLHTRYPTLIPRVKQAKSRITPSHVSFFLTMLLQIAGLTLFYALQPTSRDKAVKALFSCFSSTPAPDSYDYRFGVCAPATFAPLYIPAIAFGSFVIFVIFSVRTWSELFDSPFFYHHLPQSRHIRAPIRNRHLVELVQEILMEEMDQPLFEPMRGGDNWNQLAEANNREIDLFETPALVLNVDMRKNRVRLPAEIFPRTGVG